MFENDEDYDLYLINNKQYQSFSDKKLLALNEYLENIRPKLIELMTKDCKGKLDVNVVFRPEKLKYLNDKINIYIKSKNTTDIDEILRQLIEKQEELSESLKEINLVLEGIKSITYNFTTTKTFIETPQRLKNKKIPKIVIINVFNILSHFLYIMNKLVKIHLKYQKLNPMSTILTGKILIFHHKNKIMKLLK